MIEDFLRREIDIGSFPGASWAVGSSNGIEREGHLGHAVTVPFRIATTSDTIYDCASITKPLITTTLVLRDVAAGRISLDDRVHGYAYRELLTHTSGLRAWLPLYAFDDPLQAILEHGPECERGTRVIYSDLNFVLLWKSIDDYDRRAREEIFAPLGLSDAFIKPEAALRPRIAATEWGQRWEQTMCAERKIAWSGFREGLIWGETHDGNSHHIGAGCAGNAGLFATARAVFRIAQGIVTGELVPRELHDEATRDHTEGMDDARGYGWQKPTGSDATKMLSPRAYGHTGFTGTSVWIEPERDRIMVLLTNRVHPCAAPNAMQKIRGEFHRLAG